MVARRRAGSVVGGGTTVTTAPLTRTHAGAGTGLVVSGGRSEWQPATVGAYSAQVPGSPMVPSLPLASASQHAPSSVARPHPEAHPPSLFSALSTYLAYAVLIVFGHVRDCCGKLTGLSRYFGANSVPAKVRACVGGGGAPATPAHPRSHVCAAQFPVPTLPSGLCTPAARLGELLHATALPPHPRLVRAGSQATPRATCGTF